MNRILYINSPKNDFLADSFLIGLKSLYPGKVYEWPVNQFVYKIPEEGDSRKMHGIGFTLYRILNPESALEYRTEMPAENFDLIIFGDIYRQEKQFRQLQPFLRFQNTLILDGEDTPALFPYYFPPWKKPYSLFFPRLEKQYLYLKREIIPSRTQYYRSFKLLPGWLAAKIPLPANLLPVSFSIPAEKILNGPPLKTKDFPIHIVDPEACTAIPGAVSRYAFEKESDYYADLQQSRFGITMKRGGWDCLRHYEIAANGAVPCFRNLQDKPEVCAPHGLVDGTNCLSYRSFAELKARIGQLSDEDYQQLQKNSMDWVRSMECSRVVRKTLEAYLEKAGNSVG